MIIADLAAVLFKQNNYDIKKIEMTREKSDNAPEQMDHKKSLPAPNKLIAYQHEAEGDEKNAEGK